MPSITLTISTEKYQDFKDGFLKINPVPIDDNGNPEMTENNWIVFRIKEIIKKDYERGKTLLAREAADPTIDENIIT